jgi:hypothetical protein
MGNKGLITKGRGRAGTKITTIGIEYLHFLKANIKNKSL